jgi:hypothetical protein
MSFDVFVPADLILDVFAESAIVVDVFMDGSIIIDAASVGVSGPPGPIGPTGPQGPEGEVPIISLTQAEYDALVTPDPETFYVITDAPTEPKMTVSSVPPTLPAVNDVWVDTT